MLCSWLPDLGSSVNSPEEKLGLCAGRHLALSGSGGLEFSGCWKAELSHPLRSLERKCLSFFVPQSLP